MNEKKTEEQEVLAQIKARKSVREWMYIRGGELAAEMIARNPDLVNPPQKWAHNKVVDASKA